MPLTALPAMTAGLSGITRLMVDTPDPISAPTLQPSATGLVWLVRRPDERLARWSRTAAQIIVSQLNQPTALLFTVSDFELIEDVPLVVAELDFQFEELVDQTAETTTVGKTAWARQLDRGASVGLVALGLADASEGAIATSETAEFLVRYDPAIAYRRDRHG